MTSAIGLRAGIERSDKMNRRETEQGINRRDFLHSAAAAGAGLALSQGTLARTKSGKKPDDINVALLGAGLQGQVLVSACLKIPGVRFKAVCDIWTDWNCKRVARLLKAYRHSVNTYVDYQDMLADEKDLDAVIVATPDFWHSPHTVACLEAGLHVYCETAMSNTIEGARKMVQASRKAGKFLQIGCQRRSNPRYLHCHDKLLKGSEILGRITAVSGQWNRSATHPIGWPQRVAIEPGVLEKYGYKSMEQFRNWRWYKGLGGGPVVDLGSHQIDVYNWFLQANPRSVMASGQTNYYDNKTHEWYDTVMAVYEYETAWGSVSAYYQILSSNSSLAYCETFLGDQGTLVISELSHRGEVYQEPRIPSKQWRKWIEMGYLRAPKEMADYERDVALPMYLVSETPPSSLFKRLPYKLPVKIQKPYHQPHLEDFFDAIRGSATLNCPAEVGYATAVAVLKVNEAVEAGRKLEFKPDEFVVHDPHKEMIEHVLGARLPESARNCRYHSKSYGMGRGTGWGFFEISRADLPALLDASDNLPDASEFAQDSRVRSDIEEYLERTGESIAWWKPLTLRKRQYANKIIGSENVTERFALIMLPAINICIGEIRDGWMGVYFVYHCG